MVEAARDRAKRELENGGPPKPPRGPPPSPKPPEIPKPTPAQPQAPESEPQPVPAPAPATDGAGAVQPPGQVWSWKSQPRFGHTFLRHGQGQKNTDKLRGRAATKGTPQGQWLDNARAAAFLQQMRPSVTGPFTDVEIPPGLGQVVYPDGSVEPADRAPEFVRRMN